ncbi:MAG: carboxymuconolactone decarboxylase family protein [Nitrospinota bacterium]
METVRIRDESEFPEDMRKQFEQIKGFFKIDFVPKMVRVLSHYPEFRAGQGRCTRRALSPGELPRTTKELIATAVSTINVCQY